ncbi:hypothetical protein TPHA_0B02050 [Tetrapisispora phaffii CBS 4417]|uniref:SRR1-like domain-containing protein n=1 Tax=Tetrapisispora phaffii (strain ATCC 24235 / CBS 4417 / NBRC 1672 / NRRL Y-8282 / UCD 70-5) TaxID=1071381 RepID=G8BPE6_TETPH|nr:hypothetical protein TPHA_0B02050 [Tetrapisispora phaffii CBS 4417]CCE61877.1 hypothetical protein TPHA_0B02050 [Tetrapisispora phaffii CBS 4417]
MSQDDFKKVGKKIKNRLDTFNGDLIKFRQIIRESEFFTELVDILCEKYKGIDRIRCLALGSFHEEIPARYQFALLLEIIEKIEHENGKQLKVSIYDPVFTNDDIEYIGKNGINWTIDENPPQWSNFTDSTIYYLPHAPLDLTENVIKNEHPKIWLANNLIEHSDRYTKAQLYDKYPVIAKLVYILTSNSSVSGNSGVIQDKKIQEDGFTRFESSKKKRGRKKKLAVSQCSFDYSLIESYFNNCRFESKFNDGLLLNNKPWINSFSDLTLHIID